MGVIYNKKTKTLVNPIDWTVVDKCLLAGILIAPWYFLQALFGHYIVSEPNLVSFIKVDVQSQLNIYFIACGVFWLVLSAVALVLRRTQDENRILSIATMSLPIPMAMIILLANGVLMSSILAGSIVVAMLGFFFFDLKSMVKAIAFNFLLFLVIAALCAVDIIPYAHLYESIPQGDSAKVWLFTQYMITLYPVCCGILMTMFFMKGLNDRESKIRELSRKDGLTNIWNHRYLMEIFERELLNSARNRLPLSFLMIDLDHFKKLNDRYGHKVGDKALEVASQVLLGALRTTDHLGRYGGEEFAVVLPNCNVASAREVAERCRRAIEDTLVDYNGIEVNITASIGVTTVNDTSDVTPNTIIERADKALYKSKDKGRNCVSFYSEQVHRVGSAGKKDDVKNKA